MKTVRIAVKVVGIDGFECAIHPGEQNVGDLLLFPATAQALKTPVVASGGIADGRGLAAALALGRDGINLGTRFMVTQEVPMFNGIKQKATEMDENQTRLIFRSYKKTARVCRNVVADEDAAIEAASNDFGQVYHLVSGANKEKALSTGDIDAGMVALGTTGGLIKDIPGCETLGDNFVSDAQHIISELIVEITSCKKHIQYAPRSQATPVPHRIGCPKKTSAEIGFTTTTNLREGSERLIEWRAKHIANTQVTHEPIKWR